MNTKRISGALLTSFSTGVGIMVPYTFKSMTPPLMAVCWAALVFLGIIGLILALKPDQIQISGPSEAPAKRPAREPFVDRSILQLIAAVLAVPLILLLVQIIFRLLIWATNSIPAGH